MIKKILNIRQEIVYQDTETDRAYRRICGAVAWPVHMETGHLVIVGQEWKEDIGLQTRRLWLITEDEVNSILDAHLKMLSLRTLYSADFWVADTSDPGIMKVFRNVKHPPVTMGNRLGLNAAPLAAENVEAMVMQVNELVQPERKILHLIPGMCQEQLRIIRIEDMKKPLRDFPVLAALGYAVAQMVLHNPDRISGKANVKKDWPLTRQRGAR